MSSTNHPNRGRGTASRNPTCAEIIAARQGADLTQTAAGELVHTTCRVWQQWEKGDRRMHPAFWELFGMKLNPSVQRALARSARAQGAS